MLINNTNEYVKMNKVESNHWWYKSLYDLVLNVITKQFNTNKISILDAGCGTGGLLSFLYSNKYGTLKGFDISQEAVHFASSKNINIELKDLKNYRYVDERYDVIVSTDTMYFFNLEEQRKILNEFNKSLNSGGIVILNLPSFKIFSGTHDKAVGIKNRFSSSMVLNMIDNSQYDIIEKKYWPFLLSPLIASIRVLQKIKLLFCINNKLNSTC